MTKIHSVPVEKIKSVLTADERECIPFLFPASRITEMRASLNCTETELLLGLAQTIRPLAPTPLSHFNVGIAVLGASGTVYLGVNIEFCGIPLSQTVHAEQCAIANAWHHHEERILLVAGTEHPCGHCRQFLAELSHFNELRLIVDGGEETFLKHLLVNPFTPRALAIDEKDSPLATTLDLKVEFDEKDSSLSGPTQELVKLALDALKRSYSPIQISGRSPSALALRTKSGILSSGALIENVAFNPSLPPLQSALVQLLTVHRISSWDQIEEAVIIEDPKSLIQQKELTEAVIKVLAPRVKFTFFPITISHS